MKVNQVRRIIKNYDLNVQVMARTNGLVKATAFDVDDLSFLNYMLQKNYGYTFKIEYAGTKFERYELTQVSA